jgi:hypothetical protein
MGRDDDLTELRLDRLEKPLILGGVRSGGVPSGWGWDPVILTVVSHGARRVLDSADAHEGFAWRGASVVAQFVSPRHPMLENSTNADSG